MIYIILLCVLTLFSFFEIVEVNRNLLYRKNNKVFYFFFSCFIISLAALRYKTGGDWIAYTSWFNNGFSDRTIEPGFVFINVVFKSIFNNYFIMQFSINVLCGFLILRFICQHSEYPIFTLLLYFINYYIIVDMAIIRQHIAMAIIVCSYKYIEKRQLIPFLLLIAFAMQFHVSAIIVILLYFFNKHIHILASILIILAGIMINFFGRDMLLILFDLLSYIKILPERLILMLNYLQNEKMSGIGIYRFGLSFFAKSLIVILTVVSYYNNNTKKPIIFNSFLCGFIFDCMSRNIYILYRFPMYFYICGGGLIMYNYLFNNKLFNKLFSLKYIFIVSCLLYHLMPFYINFWGKKNYSGFLLRELYTPYYSVFSPNDDPLRKRAFDNYTNDAWN
jgi:hypothetical protein